MKRFLFFAVAAVLFAACSKDAIDEQQGIQNIVDEAPATLTVGFEDDETRIQLNEAQKTVWTNGDLVSVFYRSNANQQWQYTGETGARTADLTRVDAGEATKETQRVVVVYPYNANYYFNTETYNVQASLPATQTYLKDSYGLDGNIMVSSSEFNQFKLKTVYGWLKLQLTGSGEQIKSISLCGNNGEQVAGDVVINTTDATITLAADDDKSDATIFTEVTLDCGEGVELGAEATSFYIALPPQTFTKGLTVEITAIDGSAMTQSTDNEVVIERNHIKPMTSLTFKATKPANNEIWYTATAKVEPHDKTVFDATYLSNVWDSETGKGIITFEWDVTKIGEKAFYGYQTDCAKLTSVTIPDSVKTIGDYAFQSCSSLTSVTIPDSVTTIGEKAFYYCESLTSVTIPDSVKTIGNYAFYSCESLTSVTIGDSVTTIGDYAFSWCTSLTSVTIPNSVTTIRYGAFYSCNSLTSVTIPDSVTTIGDSAFEYCTSLTSVTIPDSVTTIGERAFNSCGSLTSVTIGDSVTTIGEGAFGYCGLTSVTIPDSVTDIANHAFRVCSSLTSVTIGDSVTTIGQFAFAYCESLATVYCKPTTPPTGGWGMFDGNASDRKIYVPAGSGADYKEKQYWSDYADYIFEDEPKPANNEIWYTATVRVVPDKISAFGATYVSNEWDSETGKGVITFDGNVTKIGDYAFYGYQTDCNKLTSVTIPDSVTTIGYNAFSCCYSLTSVTIGNGVTTIGDDAFSGCGSLTSVTIPESVMTIGGYAFQNCTSLATVYCKPTTPPAGGSHMFDDNASGRKIYVPASADDSIINAYKAKEYWSSYKNYIFEEE